MAGYRVLLFIGHPSLLLSDSYAISSITTGADGTFRLTGASDTKIMFREHRAPGFAHGSSMHLTLCGDRVLDFGEIRVQREMPILRANGQEVPTCCETPIAGGEVLVSWEPLTLAEGYCVIAEDDETAARADCPVNPPPDGGPDQPLSGRTAYVRAGTPVSGTSHTVVLTPGRRHLLQISAIRGGYVIGTVHRWVVAE